MKVLLSLHSCQIFKNRFFFFGEVVVAVLSVIRYLVGGTWWWCRRIKPPFLDFVFRTQPEVLGANLELVFRGPCGAGD